MKAVLIVALIAVAACWRNQMERPPLGGRGGGGVSPAGSASGSDLSQPALAQKTVTSKELPTMLVAFDGSTCLVTEKRFRETVVGEKAWCVWVFRK